MVISNTWEPFIARIEVLENRMHQSSWNSNIFLLDLTVAPDMLFLSYYASHFDYLNVYRFSLIEEAIRITHKVLEGPFLGKFSEKHNLPM